jgi:hypothetical protein
VNRREHREARWGLATGPLPHAGILPSPAVFRPAREEIPEHAYVVQDEPPFARDADGVTWARRVGRRGHPYEELIASVLVAACRLRAGVRGARGAP